MMARKGLWACFIVGLIGFHMDFDSSKQRQNKKNIFHIKACGRINTKDGPNLSLESRIWSQESGVGSVCKLVLSFRAKRGIGGMGQADTADSSLRSE